MGFVWGNERGVSPPLSSSLGSSQHNVIEGVRILSVLSIKIEYAMCYYTQGYIDLM